MPELEQRTRAASQGASSTTTDRKRETREHPVGTREASLRRVSKHFGELTSLVHARLDTLRRDLQREDEPSWSDTLASGLLQTALQVGMAATGQYVTSKLVKETAKVTFEAVKTMHQQGLASGVDAGLEALRAGDKKAVVDRLVDAHKDAVWTCNVVNSNHFEDVRDSLVMTDTDADALAEACDPDKMKRAAEEHFKSGRDAFVSYLAQSRFGASQGSEGESRTNVMTHEQRSKLNGLAPGTVPAAAPNADDVASGRAEGLLVVAAELPAITHGRLDGGFNVSVAMLNGVNQTIRNQYAQRSLAEAHIPRHIVAKVRGDMADFTISVDEAGGSGFPSKAASSWLYARAAVAGRGNSYVEGIAVLLSDLKPTSIVGWS